MFAGYGCELVLQFRPFGLHGISHHARGRAYATEIGDRICDRIGPRPGYHLEIMALELNIAPTRLDENRLHPVRVSECERTRRMWISRGASRWHDTGRFHEKRIVRNLAEA